MTASQQYKKLVLIVLTWAVVVVGFLMLASWLIFRASGFAYDFQTGEIQRTGLIYVRTYPATATVLLDSRIVSTITPARMSNLWPGKYNLQIEKKGYKPILKTLEVYEGLATRVAPVLLFYQEPKLGVQYSSVLNEFVDKNNNLWTITNNNIGTFVNLYNQNHERIFKSKKITRDLKNFQIFGAINQDYLVLYTPKQQAVLLDFKNNSFYSISDSFNHQAINKLSIYQDNLLILTSSGLSTFNPDNKVSRKIANNIIDFNLTSTYYALQFSSNKYRIIQINPSSYQIRNIIDQINITSPQKLFVSRDGQFAILNKNQQLFVIENKKAKWLANGVLGCEWSSSQEFLDFRDNYKLGYFTKKEIWVYRKDSKDVFDQLSEKTLVLKSKQSINKIGFYEINNYLYFTIKDQLIITDTLGTRASLKTLAPNDKFFFSGNFKSLYFLHNQIVQELTLR